MNHTGDKVSTDKAEIISRIREAMTPFLAPGTAITEDMKIGSDIEIDSVDVFDVVMELEEFYDISLPMETTSEIQTIGELADAVEHQLHV